MTTLGVAIDARGATKGANEADRATKKIIGGANRTDKALRKVDRRMKSTGATASMLGRTVGGLFAGLTATIAITKTIKTMANYEQTMQTVRAVARATDEEFVKLNNSARLMGATTIFTASQAGEGLLFMSRAGLSATESVEALPHMLNLAAAGAIELGSAADYATNIMSAFAIEAAQAERVVDVLVYTANSANTSVSQLAEAMVYAAPLAGKLGQSIEMTAAAIGVLGDSGIQASMAGTNLRGILAALLGPTGAAAAALKKAGIALEALDPATHSLVEIFDEFARAQMSAGDAAKLFNEVFGRRNVGAALTLMSYTDRMRELNGELENAEGEAERVAMMMSDTLTGAFKSLMSAVEELMLQSGDRGLLRILRDIVDFATDVIRALAGMEDKFIRAGKSAKMVAEALRVLAFAGGTFIALKLPSISLMLAASVTRLLVPMRLLGVATAATTKVMAFFKVVILACIAPTNLWRVSLFALLLPLKAVRMAVLGTRVALFALLLPLKAVKIALVGAKLAWALFFTPMGRARLLISAIFGPLFLLGKAIFGVKGAFLALKVAGVATAQAIWGAFTMGISVIIAGIAVALYALRDRMVEIGGTSYRVGDIVVASFSVMWDRLKHIFGLIATAGRMLWDSIKGTVKVVTEAVVKVWDWVGETLGVSWKGMGDTWVRYFKKAANIVLGIIKGLVRTIVRLFTITSNHIAKVQTAISKFDWKNAAVSAALMARELIAINIQSAKDLGAGMADIWADAFTTDHIGQMAQWGKDAAMAILEEYKKTLTPEKLAEFNRIFADAFGTNEILRRANQRRLDREAAQREEERKRNELITPPDVDALLGPEGAAVDPVKQALDVRANASNAADSMARSFGDAFNNIMEGGKEMEAVTLDILKGIQDALIQSLVVEPMTAMIASGMKGVMTGSVFQKAPLDPALQNKEFPWLNPAGADETVAATTQMTAAETQMAAAVMMEGAVASMAAAWTTKAAVPAAVPVVTPTPAATQPAAKGMVVDSPTYFSRADKKVGVMGEAGPEAIMPLKKDSSGRLGVSGGNKTYINMTVNTPNADSFRASNRQIANQLRRAVMGGV
jgi:TP901 family phage tail tape measure protein